jgi:3-methylfumaryl-CoA hydratase
MPNDGIDTTLLKSWIGREETAEDVLTPELAKRFRATLDQPAGDLSVGAPAPLAVHWCLALPAAPASEIGPDGHPRRGGFLPPAPLPRRMWAGGGLEFLAPLRIGDEVRRRSRVDDIVVKEGRSGVLCFVTVRHEISNADGLALRERHDIVYRAIAPPGQPSLPPAEEPAPWRRSVAVDPVLLFRYSALTFNGHRIHYDRTYCIEEEHYSGLVVHGPLQATMLLQFGADLKGPPRAFEFRAVSPVFDGGEVGLHARDDAGGLSLWLTDQGGRLAMTATASP